MDAAMRESPSCTVLQRALDSIYASPLRVYAAYSSKSSLARSKYLKRSKCPIEGRKGREV